MSSQEDNISQTPSAVFSTSQDIFLSSDIILYMSKFLSFEDYKSFIQACWPNGDEDDTIRAKLWQLSTHKFKAEFLNGKQLEIEYNFDSTRTKENRILINLDSLSPVFAGTAVPVVHKFTSVSKLNKYLKKHVHLTKCLNHRRDRCDRRHVYHECWKNVVRWLTGCLQTLILLQEAKRLFSDNITYQYSIVPDDIVHYQTDKRETWKFLQDNATKFEGSFEESDIDDSGICVGL